jgi:hypothetical protein
MSADVRDLDKEGVYIALTRRGRHPAPMLSVTQSIFTLQAENKKLRERLGRLEEVVADLMRRAA